MKICYFGAYDDSYPRNKVIRQGLKKNGIGVYECHDNTHRIWRRYPKLLGKFLKLPKDFQTIIVAEFGQTNVLLAKILSIFFRKKLIFDSFVLSYEAYVIDRKWYKKNSLMARWLHFLDKQAVKLSDYILCQTEEQADDYSREFGIKKPKIKVLYLGSNDELFYPQEVNRQDHDFKILFYGTYTAQTGLEYVLRAAGELKKQKEIKFYFIGDNPPAIRKLCQELALTNATFEGRIGPEQVPRRIAASDIILGIFGDTPKGHNVVSNRVIQAMAMKKPLITGKTHPIDRMLKDKTEALLCPLCDAKSIVESILLLYRDKDLRNKLAKNGHEFYRKYFTPEVIGRELKQILEDIMHTKPCAGKIKPAGERFLPGITDKDFSPHRHNLPYEFCAAFINRKKVLEVGCGEGWGSFYLAGNAAQITGIDIDKDIIEYASGKYKKDNLSFKVMPATELDFIANTFDIVISLHVIEHLDPEDLKRYLEEIKRVLKDNGTCIFATPNRKIQLEPRQKPLNRYHIQEYEWRELEDLFKKYFSQVKMYGIVASERAFKQELQRVRPNTVFDKFTSLLTRLDIFKIRRLPVLKLFARTLVNILGWASKKIIKKSKDYIPISAVKKEDFKISDIEAKMTLDLLAVCGKN